MYHNYYIDSLSKKVPFALISWQLIPITSPSDRPVIHKLRTRYYDISTRNKVLGLIHMFTGLLLAEKFIVIHEISTCLSYRQKHGQLSEVSVSRMFAFLPSFERRPNAPRGMFSVK